MGRPRVPAITVACEWCGQPFQAYARDHRRFCTRSCSSANAMSGRDLTGSANPRYNGGLSTRRDGRTIIIHRDGTHSLYARAVMEGHLGRLLHVDEVVHHRNGDCTDDRVENLQVLTRAAHIEHHRADLLAAKARKRIESDHKAAA